MTTADRLLAATPLAESGAPLAVEPTWCRSHSAGERGALLAYWSRGLPTPIVGARVRRDGVELCEVTFLAEADPGNEVMVHLNGLTDNHRRDIEPALLQPIGNSSVHHLTYLLPADGVYGYRFVQRANLDRTAGETREGWLSIHRAGRPDPRNPASIPHAHGDTSSVWTGPDAPTTAGWGECSSLPELTVTHADGQTRRVWARPGSTDHWLIVHDGQVWRQLGLESALAAAGQAPGLVLIDSGDHARRAGDLPLADRVQALTSDVLARVSHAYGGDPDPARIVVAGQSFGGLAAALTVTGRPDLATTAIVQSGSFWFDPGEARVAPHGSWRPGRLLRELVDHPAGRMADRRFILQAGTDEGDMIDGACAAASALRHAGARVGLEQYRGGHDFAWWRHGLVRAYSTLAGDGLY